jgi:hypothetical protein
MRVIQQSIAFKPITIELESPAEVFAILNCIKGYRGNVRGTDKNFASNMSYLDRLYAELAECRV